MKRNTNKLQPEFTFDGFKLGLKEEGKTTSFYFDRNTKDESGCYRLWILDLTKSHDIVIEDSNCDGKVEKVRFGLVEGMDYRRGEQGTERIFEKVDKLFLEKFKELNIAGVRKEWKEKFGRYPSRKDYHSDLVENI